MISIFKHSFWFLFLIFFAACSPGVTASNLTPKAATHVSLTPISPTTIVQIEQAVTLTKTPLPTIVKTPLPLFKLEGLRAGYIIKGNLYVQDSGGQPVQLTHSGQDTDPIFSDDGQKIVFYRGGKLSKNTYQVYQINADGSGEAALVTSALLTALNIGYDESTELRSLFFVRGTHKLLFTTEQFPPNALRNGDSKPQPNRDMLIADTDTGKITQLRAPGYADSFGVSPNGKLIWLGTEDHIDLIGMDGKLIRQNFIVGPPASPGMPDMWNPILQWARGGDQLFVIPLAPTVGALGNDGVPEPRTIWRHPINGGKALETRISPPLMGNMFEISPDENWVVYTFGAFAQTVQDAPPAGIYLANLHDGTTKLIGAAESYDLPVSPASYHWSPDSTHFIFEDYQDKMFLGDIQGEIVPLGAARFVQWLDSSRYLCNRVIMGEISTDENSRVIELTPNSLYNDYQSFTIVIRKVK